MKWNRSLPLCGEQTNPRAKDNVDLLTKNVVE
jgi:hypothetical protein